MKQYVTRRIAYGLFVTILVIFFLWKFGHPAVVKFISNEVFLKISTEPSDRTRLLNIPLPAVTFCPSNRSSAISQVILPTRISEYQNIRISEYPPTAFPTLSDISIFSICLS